MAERRFVHFFFCFLSLLEIERVQKDEPEKDGETYLDLFTAKNIKLKERVLIPVKQYPKVSVALWQLAKYLYVYRSFVLDHSPIMLHIVPHD